MANLTRKYSNKGIVGRGDEKIKIPISLDGEVSTETRHVFLAILNNIQFRTSEDSIQGARLADAIDEAKGKDIIEIGEGVHDWLTKRINETIKNQMFPEGYQICPFIFRVNGDKVSEFIKNGYKKAHSPEEKKKGKAKTDEPPESEK